MRVVIRILVGLVGILLVAVIGLGIAVAVDRAQGGGRLAAVANTTVAGTTGPDVAAYVARPAGPGPHPAVIMIHEFWGLRPDVVDKADLLAEQGYVVIAPDLFRGGATDFLPSAIVNVVTSANAAQVEDLDAVFGWLTSQSDVDRQRIATLGFCFGGGAALRYSLTNSDLAATVVFYGQPVTDAEQLKRLSGPVLGIFGGADASIPQEDVRAFDAALTEAGIAHTVTVYDGQPHAFVGRVDAIQAGGAPGDAWSQMVTFLEQSLQTTTAHDLAPRPAVALQDDRWTYALRLAWSHLFNTSPAHAH